MSIHAGKRLQDRRKEMGLTLCDVAERVRARGNVKVSESHYRRIERAICVPTVVLAMEITEVLDTDVYSVWG